MVYVLWFPGEFYRIQLIFIDLDRVGFPGISMISDVFQIFRLYVEGVIPFVFGG